MLRSRLVAGSGHIPPARSHLARDEQVGEGVSPTLDAGSTVLGHADSVKARHGLGSVRSGIAPTRRSLHAWKRLGVIVGSRERGRPPASARVGAGPARWAPSRPRPRPRPPARERRSCARLDRRSTSANPGYGKRRYRRGQRGAGQLVPSSPSGARRPAQWASSTGGCPSGNGCCCGSSRSGRSARCDLRLPRLSDRATRG
jgi:hypothetical protein